ncbi:tetratricopeptide repeat protein [Herbaspirillum autotrophicum]|uniref:tetratricopeptide repeat protein n=1 Tax=Herbaspirillum autotrophicum TaxID=180195 RepID=UPI00067B25A1|nr:tetratricopeptide repeat protein [Herbaspirillum autotrophicum]
MTTAWMNRSALAQILGRQLLERRLAGAGGHAFGLRLTQQLRTGYLSHARLCDGAGEDAVALRFHHAMQACYQLAAQVMRQAYPHLETPATRFVADKVTDSAINSAADTEVAESLSAGAMVCPEELIELGHLARVRNFLPASEQIFEMLISMFPESVPAHMGSGMLRLDQGLYPAAQVSFETACWLAPDEGMAHIWLGLVLLMRERPQQAAEVISRALQAQHLTPEVLVAKSLLDLPVLAPFSRQRRAHRLAAGGSITTTGGRSARGRHEFCT